MTAAGKTPFWMQKGISDEQSLSIDVKVANSIIGIISKLIFYVIVLLFVLISAVMLILAFYSLWVTVSTLPAVNLEFLFESIGYTTVASAVFELARTMFDEEVKSKIKMNAPRKIRHFISRFMTVIIISLSIEFLTMVFRYSHKLGEFTYLFESAAVAFGIGVVFVAWSYFNKSSVEVEKWEEKTPSPGPESE
jgi:uncharacterized membrane protein